MARRPSDFEWWRDADGDYTVPVLTAANLLVIDLERRGVILAMTDDDRIVATPADRLTEEDRHHIRSLKPWVLAVLRYQPPRVQ